MYEISEDTDTSHTIGRDTTVLRGACLTLRGVVDGDLSIQTGARTKIYGTVTGNLTVLQGSQATIHGTVDKNVFNAGSIEVYGTVGGQIYDNGADAYIDENAEIDTAEA